MHGGRVDRVHADRADARHADDCHDGLRTRRDGGGTRRTPPALARPPGRDRRVHGLHRLAVPGPEHGPGAVRGARPGLAARDGGRVSADGGGRAALPGQRPERAGLVGDDGAEDRADGPRVRRERPGLDDDRGERGGGRRMRPPGDAGGARAADSVGGLRAAKARLLLSDGRRLLRLAKLMFQHWLVSCAVGLRTHRARTACKGPKTAFFCGGCPFDCAQGKLRPAAQPTAWQGRLVLRASIADISGGEERAGAAHARNRAHYRHCEGSPRRAVAARARGHIPLRPFAAGDARGGPALAVPRGGRVADRPVRAVGRGAFSPGGDGPAGRGAADLDRVRGGDHERRGREALQRGTGRRPASRPGARPPVGTRAGDHPPDTRRDGRTRGGQDPLRRRQPRRHRRPGHLARPEALLPRRPRHRRGRPRLGAAGGVRVLGGAAAGRVLSGDVAASGGSARRVGPRLHATVGPRACRRRHPRGVKTAS